MNNLQVFDLISRILMGLVFVWTGTDKLRWSQPLSGVLNAHGYKISPGIVRLCGICELVAVTLLVANIFVPAVALALALFVLVSNLMVNSFWTKTGMDAAQAKQRMMPGVGMVVGLIYMAGVAYLGPSR